MRRNMRRLVNRRSMLNSNRRRRVMNRRNMLNSGRQRLNSAVEGDIVYYSELNQAQKDYVLSNWDKWSELNWLWESYNEYIMDWYNYELAELTDKFKAEVKANVGVDIDVNTDKIYWQSNSQGPYPEWRFDEIFDEITYAPNGEAGPIAYVQLEESENRRSRLNDVTVLFNLEYRDTDEDGKSYWTSDDYLEIADLFNGNGEPNYLGVTEQFENGLVKLTQLGTEYMQKVWNLIRETDSSYPEWSWVDEELEAFSYDDIATFEIIDDNTAIPERAASDDFNTYVDY